MHRTEIGSLKEHIGEEVEIRGWIAKKRSSGKIAFLQLRDGSGYVQAVASRKELPEEMWASLKEVTQGIHFLAPRRRGGR